MAICIAVLFLGHQDGNSQGIQTSRRKIMQLARIRSIVTYHKCIRELTAFGYITYCPSYHPAKGSLIDLKIED
ncbi:hypothetical protein [Mucilaginibacter terrae]|uniref:hypothetical protein n=1 Tax=Mucilaginibacter terrae TaxID=1955052 RepID=UPI00289C1A30|nr:hypothetical protein [Mucilaginibacter terrae]